MVEEDEHKEHDFALQIATQKQPVKKLSRSLTGWRSVWMVFLILYLILPILNKVSHWPFGCGICIEYGLIMIGKSF